MLEWLRRRRRDRVVAPTITPRADPADIARIELAELTPIPEIYLGRIGYLSLVLFEDLARAVEASPTTASKVALGRVASGMLAVHEGLVAELRTRGDDPIAAMDPYRDAFDDFQRRTKGEDWYEMLVTCYLTIGFFFDFAQALAVGLPEPLAGRVRALLDSETGEEVIVEILREAIDPSPRLASRLALWGRRLIGDAILVVRTSLEKDGALPTEERTEPAFAELVAQHTRRMDALGLTA